MKILKIQLTYDDINGNPVVKQEEIQYDPNVYGVVAEVEYVSPQNGGPVMRPRKPRL